MAGHTVAVRFSLRHPGPRRSGCRGGFAERLSVRCRDRRILARFEPVAQVLAYILVGSFFAAMGIKLGLSKSPDAKRRLRFLYWGAIAAFVPRACADDVRTCCKARTRARYSLPGLSP